VSNLPRRQLPFCSTTYVLPDIQYLSNLNQNTTEIGLSPRHYNMADRFPSLEEFDSGGRIPSASFHSSILTQVDIQGATTLDLNPTMTLGEDFLTRERAALGDDATQFASGNDAAAFLEDGDDDLLGGGGRGEEIEEFQSSFPAIDARNNVRFSLSSSRV
jgi:Clathrin light chain